MRIPRIFHPEPLSPEQEVELLPQSASHLIRVLRLKPGAELRLFNGDGKEYQAHISQINRNHCQVHIQTSTSVSCESPLDITLVQAISKGERMDYTIQKAIELGVNHIIPVFSERSVVQLKGDRLDKKMQHWQGVITSACEQCGRNTIPQLAPALPLEKYLAQADDNNLKLILAPEATTSLNELHRPQTGITILTGPEGGMSDFEITHACELGFQAIRMGPRVLRTETAAVAALSLIQGLWGDLAG